jgi:hypothetical protein
MNKLEDMSLYEAPRWVSLIDAIDTIDNKCKKSNKSFDKVVISPVDLKKYINNTFETHYINFGHYLEDHGIFLSKERPPEDIIEDVEDVEDKSDDLILDEVLI